MSCWFEGWQCDKMSLSQSGCHGEGFVQMWKQRGNAVNYQEYYEVLCSPISAANKLQKWQNSVVSYECATAAFFFFYKNWKKYEK